MAGNRKLQQEITQVLKKIEEGMNDFDEIWEKVYASETQAQKERWEAELKKEIKKLQRFRDQIKSWVSNPEIKDKNPLVEARKNVESKMEQFKICERETKTKAYSREGLAREAKVDPREADKEDKRAWLNDCTENLSLLIETLEADLEKLSSGGKKGKNKEQVEKLVTRIKKNKWHVMKLEQIKRLMENDDLEPTALDEIKDDVDYYIETAPEDDGSQSYDEMLEFNIYESLKLDSCAISIGVLPAGGAPDDEREADGEDDKSDKKKKSATTPSPSTPAGKSAAKPAVTPVANVASVAAVIGKPVAVAPAVVPATAAAATVKPAAPASVAPAVGTAAAPAKPSAVPVPAPVDAKAVAAKPTVAAIVAGTAVKDAPAAPSSWATAAASGVTNVSAPTTGKASPPLDSKPSVASIVVGVSNVYLNQGNDLLKPSGRDENRGQTQAAQIAPPAGTASSAPANVVIAPRPAPAPLSNDLLMSLHMLKQSSLQSSGEGSRSTSSSQHQYAPRNAYNAHPSFPTSLPVGILDNPRLFERLSTDTLFLAFYYQPGSYQQYLAAKQLKKLSWRYHKKYMTWFQRHEEPKVTADDYEEGAYVFFDYETGWSQRIKSDFKFEYIFLEDELS